MITSPSQSRETQITVGNTTFTLLPARCRRGVVTTCDRAEGVWIVKNGAGDEVGVITPHGDDLGVGWASQFFESGSKNRLRSLIAASGQTIESALAGLY